MVLLSSSWIVSKRRANQLEQFKKEETAGAQRNKNKNKEERFSRVPRLLDICYSAKGTKGKWRYASSKARLKCATYPRSQHTVMWAVDRFQRYGR